MDPLVADIEEQHRQLDNMVQQELEKCPSAYPPASQTEALFPAK